MFCKCYFWQDYEKPLFGTSLLQTKNTEETDLMVSQMLCLPVSAGELLQANHAAGVCIEVLLLRDLFQEKIDSNFLTYKHKFSVLIRNVSPMCFH